MTEDTTSSDLTRAGVVKVSIPLLESLFAGKCRVLRAAITDEDFWENTVSLVVADHPGLPVVRGGQRLPDVRCQFTRHEDGGLSIAFTKSTD